MKTSLVLVAGAALALLAMNLIQEQGQAQPAKKGPFDLGATVTPADNKNRFPNLTPSLPVLANNVADLQESVAALKKEVAALKAALNKTNSSVEKVKSDLAVPAGYTSTWMSRANLDRVKGNELMRFHVQVVTPGAPGSK